MNIKLKNIAKISTADVTIEKITVIAGENSSGKSTIGKVLYSILENDKEDLETRLNAHFFGTLLNLHKDSYGLIDFNSDDFSTKIEIKNDIFKIDTSGKSNVKVVYIDDPHILDIPKNVLKNLIGIYPEYRINLANTLFSNKDTNENEYVTAIADIVNGKLVIKNEAFFLNLNGNLIDIKNVSSGMKTLLILERLIALGKIDKHTLLILDEPETHLHPDWQVFLAEFVTALAAKENVKILINTHSPYLLNAIEVFSNKNKIVSSLKFYLTENYENSSNIVDYTENVEEVYKKMVVPFLKLDEEAYLNE